MYLTTSFLYNIPNFIGQKLLLYHLYSLRLYGSCAPSSMCSIFPLSLPKSYLMLINSSMLRYAHLYSINSFLSCLFTLIQVQHKLNSVTQKLFDAENVASSSDKPKRGHSETMTASRAKSGSHKRAKVVKAESNNEVQDSPRITKCTKSSKSMH